MVSHTSLLRESGIRAGIDIDTKLVTGQSADPDGGVENAALLRRFTVAVIQKPEDLEAARIALVRALGPGRAAQAAAIIADFDAINRVADATGIDLDAFTADRNGDLIDDLGFAAILDARR
ncbi:MAG: hypothetical protein V3R77_09720 [Candidatus Binatia bacterium]